MGHEFHEPLGYLHQQSWKAKLIIKEMSHCGLYKTFQHGPCVPKRGHHSNGFAKGMGNSVCSINFELEPFPQLLTLVQIDWANVLNMSLHNGQDN